MLEGGIMKWRKEFLPEFMSALMVIIIFIIVYFSLWMIFGV